MAGRSPITIAATVIYMSSLIFDADVTVTKIANKTGVSEGTIKTSFKVMYEDRNELIDPSWANKVRLESFAPDA